MWPHVCASCTFCGQCHTAIAHQLEIFGGDLVIHDVNLKLSSVIRAGDEIGVAEPTGTSTHTTSMKPRRNTTACQHIVCQHSCLPAPLSANTRVCQHCCQPAHYSLPATLTPRPSRQFLPCMCKLVGRHSLLHQALAWCGMVELLSCMCKLADGHSLLHPAWRHRRTV